VPGGDIIDASAYLVGAADETIFGSPPAGQVCPVEVPVNLEFEKDLRWP
jgi:hypothetical protein